MSSTTNSTANTAASGTAAAPSTRLVWADIGPEDEEAPQTSSKKALSSSSSTESKEGPIRQVTEIVTNEKGQKIRVTRKVRSVLRPVRVNKKVVDRRRWKKFGDCSSAPKGQIEQNVTYTSFEVITLDLRPKKREEEKEESGLEKIQGGSSSIVVCRNCGLTGHWTLKCPKRSQIAVTPYPTEAEAAKEKEAAAAQSSSGEGSSAAPSTNDAPKFIPLHLRGGEGRRGVSSLRDNEATLRVTNLAEDVTEADLAELFRRFGHTTRIYLARDHITGANRGFAFISFTNRQDAQMAIDKVNGHGYENLILRVEWSRSGPREDKEGGGEERARNAERDGERERERFDRRRY